LEGSIKTKKKEILKGIKENWQKVILSLSFITPIFIVPTAGFYVFCVGGMVAIFFFCNKGVKSFISIFLFSFIIASFMFGEIGFSRYSIFPQLLVFFIYSVSIPMFIEFVMSGKIKTINEQKDFHCEAKDLLPAIKSTLLCYLFFMFIPFGLQKITERQVTTIPDNIKKGFAQKIALDENVIGENDLLIALEEKTDKELEEYNDKYIFKTLRYRDFLAKEFEAGKGVKFETDDETLCFRLFGPFPFKRTVLGSHFIIFPGITREDLKKFEGDEIMVSGNIVTFRRLSRRHVGAVIVAQQIGYLEDGKWKWMDVNDLE